MSAKKSSQTPRPRHVPQRTCIACRRTDAKRGLVRLVRDSAGRVTYDPTGKRAGRGAYLCHDPKCWELALKRNGLTRALRVETLHADDVATLQTLVQSLAVAEDQSEQPAAGE